MQEPWTRAAYYRQPITLLMGALTGCQPGIPVDFHSILRYIVPLLEMDEANLPPPFDSQGLAAVHDRVLHILFSLSTAAFPITRYRDGGNVFCLTEHGVRVAAKLLQGVVAWDFQEGSPGVLYPDRFCIPEKPVIYTQYSYRPQSSFEDINYTDLFFKRMGPTYLSRVRHYLARNPKLYMFSSSEQLEDQLHDYIVQVLSNRTLDHALEFGGTITPAYLANWCAQKALSTYKTWGQDVLTRAVYQARTTWEVQSGTRALGLPGHRVARSTDPEGNVSLDYQGGDLRDEVEMRMLCDRVYRHVYDGLQHKADKTCGRYRRSLLAMAVGRTTTETAAEEGVSVSMAHLMFSELRRMARGYDT